MKKIIILLSILCLSLEAMDKADKKYKLGTLIAHEILPTLEKQKNISDLNMGNYSHWYQKALQLDQNIDKDQAEKYTKIFFKRVAQGGNCYLEILSNTINKDVSRLKWLQNFSGLLYFFLSQTMNETIDSEGPKKGWSFVLQDPDKLFYNYFVTDYKKKVSHPDYIKEVNKEHITINHLIGLHEKAYVIDFTANIDAEELTDDDKDLPDLPYRHTRLLLIYDQKHGQTFIRTGDETDLWWEKDNTFTNKLLAAKEYALKALQGEENTCTKKEHLSSHIIKKASAILGVNLDKNIFLNEIYAKLFTEFKKNEKNIDKKYSDSFLIQFYRHLYERFINSKILDDCSSTNELELLTEEIHSSYRHIPHCYGNEAHYSLIELALAAWPYKYLTLLQQLVQEALKKNNTIKDPEIHDEKDLKVTIDWLYTIVNYYKKLQKLIRLHNNCSKEKYPLQKIRNVAKEITGLTLIKLDEFGLQNYLKMIQTILVKILDSKFTDMYLTQLPIFEQERHPEICELLGIKQQ